MRGNTHEGSNPSPSANYASIVKLDITPGFEPGDEGSSPSGGTI